MPHLLFICLYLGVPSIRKQLLTEQYGMGINLMLIYVDGLSIKSPKLYHLKGD